MTPMFALIVAVNTPGAGNTDFTDKIYILPEAVCEERKAFLSGVFEERWPGSVSSGAVTLGCVPAFISPGDGTKIPLMDTMVTIPSRT